MTTPRKRIITAPVLITASAVLLLIRLVVPTERTAIGGAVTIAGAIILFGWIAWQKDQTWTLELAADDKKSRRHATVKTITFFSLLVFWECFISPNSRALWSFSLLETIAYWAVILGVPLVFAIVGAAALICRIHSKALAKASSTRSVEDRLDELERLKRRDMVTAGEYAAKRQEILNDL